MQVVIKEIATWNTCLRNVFSKGEVTLSREIVHSIVGNIIMIDNYDDATAAK